MGVQKRKSLNGGRRCPVKRTGIASCVTATGSGMREGSRKTLKQLGRLPQAENASYLFRIFPLRKLGKGKRVTYFPV